MRNKTVGQLVAEKPMSAKIFDEARIDFCCGGNLTLEQACEKAGVSLDSMVARLEQCEVGSDTGADWNNVTLTELIEHIEKTHHVYVKSELPRLAALATKVARVHGERAPEMVELAEVFLRFKEEQEQHTMKEEMVLFPYIRSLESEPSPSAPPFGTVANPIACMEGDHDNAGMVLAKMRSLTGDYSAPEDACGSWKALVGGLESLDLDLRTHVHKENSILFPKAILLEKRVLSAS
ncbi:MAG: iron-sulfur cluster repair di-iron protein [Candidatus Melainabacteria bacterium]|nr:iron-sulfur cluster repair di-iron protein [Candidatus Melainabacteria bacterium]